jgi:glycosyltransferase involved in cell wall biosynthesis
VVNALAGLGSTGGRAPVRQHRLAHALAFGSLRVALRATHVIVQNPDDQAFLIERGIVDAANCELIRGSGVDVTRFRPASRTGREPVVLLASRLLWSKGIRDFVEAASRIRQGHPNVTFMIAGSPDPGNPDTLLPADIESLSSHPDVVFRGHVADMAALLAGVDIAVLPTSYGEGVPRILVEAAACGLPLVASNMPGCREIVRPNVNGFLVPTGDSESLAGAIDRLISNPELRAQMGRESRRMAEREFSEEIVLESTLKAYNRLLELHSAAQLQAAGI